MHRAAVAVAVAAAVAAAAAVALAVAGAVVAAAVAAAVAAPGAEYLFVEVGEDGDRFPTTVKAGAPMPLKVAVLDEGRATRLRSR